MYTTIFLIASCVIICLFVALEALRGKKRGFAFSLARIITAILSAVIAIPIAKAIVPGVTEGTIIPLLQEIDEYKEVAALVPSLESDVLPAYVSMIAAPILFIVIFFIIFLAFSIILWIVRKVFFKGKTGILFSKLGGVICGAVCGLILAVMLIAPIRGTAEVSYDAVDKLGKAGVDMSSAQVAVDGLQGVKNEPVGGFVLKIGGQLVYTELSSAEIKGDKVTLAGEVSCLTEIGGKAMSVADAFKNIKEIDDEDIENMESIADNFGESSTLRTVASEFIANASRRWLNDEAVLKMEKPELGEIINPTFDAALKIFTTSDSDNVASDVDTCMYVFATLAKKGILKVDTSKGYSEMLTKLGETNAVADIVTELGSNERMAPLTSEITGLSVRALASTLGIPKNASEQYDKLMNGLADSVKNAKGDKDVLAKALEEKFTDYGINVPTTLSGDVAAAMIKDMGDGEITPDRMTEFFKVYAAASQGGQSSSAKTSNGDTLLFLADNGTQITRGANGEAILPDGTVLQYYSYDDIFTSGAFNMPAPEGSDLATLSSAASMVSDMLNLEKLLSSGTLTVENAAAEGERLNKMILTAAKLTDMVGDGKKFDVAGVIGVLGELMDDMSGSELFGGEKMTNMLTAILQSDVVKKEIGYSPKEAKELTETIKQSAAEDGSYKTVMASVAKAVEVAISADDSSMTDEEREAKITELMNDLTKTNAAVIEKMITPTVLRRQGVPEANCVSCAKVAGDLFHNLAAFDGSKEEYNKEAAAVNKLFKLALSSKSGKVSMEPEEYISEMVESKVVSKTIKQTAYDSDGTLKSDPLGLASTLSGSKAKIELELSKYYANHSDSETVKTLNAMSAVCGADVRFN